MDASKSPQWKFWIDVGGTFTDCVAQAPDGTEHFSKVLSSGVIKGQIRIEAVNAGSVPTTAVEFIDPASSSDKTAAGAFPPNDLQALAPDRWQGIDSARQEQSGFWNGATLRLLDQLGQAIWEGTVRQSALGQAVSGLRGYFELAVSQLSSAAKLDDQHPLDGHEYRYELDPGLPAPILAIHLLQNIPIRQQLLPCQVDLGTTRGTNALLTRTGARTALLTSRGMVDLLRIGDQARTKLFALTVEKSAPLFQSAIEIEERVLVDGTIECVPDKSTVTRQLEELKRQGIESLAICFMFGFRYPDHEQLVAQIARRVGFQSIRCSSDVAPVIKIVPRGETTVLDAYLDPVIANYIEQIRSHLHSTGDGPEASDKTQLRLMTSSGGLVSQARFSGKDSVLSGPAGGVVGASRVGQQLGFQQIIGFDMGGTSTDVCRFDGSYSRSYETHKAGVRIVSPMLEVETVAAGGGSVCWFDGSKLRVGPHSAGAHPGPVCYGRGGPLAITDVNLFLGRFQPDQFPFELDRVAVERRLDELLEELRPAGYALDRVELANGFLEIANHNMAAAIESVSIAKGFDPREYLLVSFGGAGSQHCCGVAEQLGMTRILDHPLSSVLSALGIRLADQSAHVVEGLNWMIAPNSEDFATRGTTEFRQVRDSEQILNREILPKLIQQAIEQLRSDGNQLARVELECSLDLRYRGTDPFLNVNFDRQTLELEAENFVPPKASGSLEASLKQFLELHGQQFGYLQNRPIEIVSIRVEAKQPGNPLQPKSHPPNLVPRSSQRERSLFSLGRSQVASLFDRAELNPGDQVVGPSIIADSVSTTIVDSGWVAKVIDGGVLLLERIPTASDTSVGDQRPGEEPAAVDAGKTEFPPDPIRLEIFNNHFSSIAGQMGIALQKTSVSVNVKERLDFSCAIFSSVGDLIVNAPHIPVHLGAMSETVRSIIQLNPRVARGDVFVTNDPYAGGSHLPDITVVTPVFSPTGSQLWFWVASRSHHAEIGGMAPGSMPANATCLGQEGVLIQNFQLMKGGLERFDDLYQILTTVPYPSRSPDENIADLKAQVAANRTGAMQLFRLVEQYSFKTVAAYMRFIQEAAEQKVRAALRRLPDGEFSFRDQLDNGATICVRLSKQADELNLDFTGTDGVLSDNLNANRAIVSAAIMYVLRLLIDEEIPLNEGVLKPVTLVLPECFLNPSPATDPFHSPAIVGGNVETSQRVVDCLLGGLGLAAASQGTMNNWLMGNESFGYYETVGGGAGATPKGPGADAVHCHMTNTRLTDPEILETRYPVILRQFSIRRGSGGAGLHPGGNGMIREIEFRQSMTVSLLTSRRVQQPFGLAGGSPGAAGVNQRIHADRQQASAEALPSRCEVLMQPGDRLRLETPGGGGWGEPQ